MSTLQVFFYGLIAFVSQDTAFTALVQNTEPIGGVFHTHKPLLAIPKANLANQDDCTMAKKLNGEDFCLWTPRFVQILLPQAGSGLSYVQGLRGNPFKLDPLPQRSGEAEDFTWLALFRDLTPTYSTVDPDCLLLPPQCGYKSTSVLARVDITSGTVRTCHLVAVAEDKEAEKAPIYAVQFVDRTHKNPRPVVQALADGVGVTTDLVGDTIELVPFNKTTPTEIKVKPDKNAVRVFILNAPAKMPPPDYGDDYALLYDFSVQGWHLPDQSRYLPHLIKATSALKELQPAGCYPEVVALVDLDEEAQTGLFRPICPMGLFVR